MQRERSKGGFFLRKPKSSRNSFLSAGGQPQPLRRISVFPCGCIDHPEHPVWVLSHCAERSMELWRPGAAIPHPRSPAVPTVSGKTSFECEWWLSIFGLRKNGAGTPVTGVRGTLRRETSERAGLAAMRRRGSISEPSRRAARRSGSGGAVDFGGDQACPVHLRLAQTGAGSSDSNSKTHGNSCRRERPLTRTPRWHGTRAYRCGRPTSALRQRHKERLGLAPFQRNRTGKLSRD